MKIVSHERRRGTALVLVLILLTVGSAVAYGLVDSTQDENRFTRFKGDYTQQQYLVLGALRFARFDLMQRIANFNPPDPLAAPVVDTVVMDNPAATYNGRAPAQVTATYEIRHTGANFSQTDPDGVVSNRVIYEIVAWLNPLGPNEDQFFANKRAHMTVEITETPIFQYAVFYTPRFEFFPGPSMTIGGRIHANGDAYIGANAGLQIDTTYLRVVGDIYRYRFDNTSNRGSNTLEVDVAGTNTTWNNTFDHDSANWETDVITNFDSIIQDSAHGVGEVGAPDVGTMDHNVGNYYFDESATPGSGGLQILDSGDPTKNDDGYTDGFKVTLDGIDRTADFIANGIITRDTMFDGREEKNVDVLEVDMGKLSSSSAPYDYWPTSGLVYVARTDTAASGYTPGTGGDPTGVRLVNGSDLAPGKTVAYTPVVVSSNPVFVQGDYNTAGTKNPTVVMADAVNLLSNAWDDSKTNGNLPAASDTTFNMAFITGVVSTDTVNGNYSGGLENLPRFHENWSGRTATLRGSFISLWESQYQNARWVYGSDNYTAPNRDWAFDPIFLGAQSKYFPNAVAQGRTVFWFEEE